MKRLIKTITSFFYLGHSPYMPGTIGSLGGLVVYYMVKNNDVLYAYSILFLFILGMLFAGEAEKVYKRKDARMIVIDEAFGMLLALFFVPYSLYMAIIGFFLFRVFDVLKPWPAKQMEKLTGALGIMFDDIIAAMYTNFLLQIIFRFIICYVCPRLSQAG